MRVWSGKIFRLLKCLAPFDCACVSLGTSSYLSSSAFSSCEDHVPISYVKHFWSRLWKEIIAKTTLQAVGMSKSSLMPLFPRYLSRQKQNIMWHLLFFVPTPVFLPNKQEKKTISLPSSTGFDSTRLWSSPWVIASLWSSWALLSAPIGIM